MAVEDYIGGIGGLMTMAALFAGNKQNQNNQDLMNLLNQSEEIVPDATGTIKDFGVGAITDDQKKQSQVAPYDPDALLEELFSVEGALTRGEDVGPSQGTF